MWGLSFCCRIFSNIPGGQYRCKGKEDVVVGWADSRILALSPHHRLPCFGHLCHPVHVDTGSWAWWKRLWEELGGEVWPLFLQWSTPFPKVSRL